MTSSEWLFLLKIDESRKETSWTGLPLSSAGNMSDETLGLERFSKTIDFSGTTGAAEEKSK
jgi:hypothetical protein